MKVKNMNILNWIKIIFLYNRISPAGDRLIKFMYFFLEFLFFIKFRNFE